MNVLLSIIAGLYLVVTFMAAVTILTFVYIISTEASEIKKNKPNV